MTEIVTAAVLIIGNEILSGRTQDLNLAFLGESLNEIGIRLKEARVVGDEEDEIIATLNALRARYHYVFTTGGIGPTHDDITADSVAKAFGVTIGYHPQAYAALKAYYEDQGMEANEARMRMARVPDGARLINNEVNLAPGFQIENVFVLAGIPSVAKAMFDGAKSQLEGGESMRSRSVRVHVGEGTVAQKLAELQQRYPDVEVGSYPWADDGQFGTSLVLRSSDERRLSEAFDAVFELAAALGGEPVEEQSPA